MARTVPQNPEKPNDDGQLSTLLRRKEALPPYISSQIMAAKIMLRRPE